ncbi:MAG TPA: hypothetical protein VHM88_21530, partial [Candidatus Acidoferrales bacterium]|nr:hypothetical protein [Candidatus Acidoferrales bacterium]
MSLPGSAKPMPPSRKKLTRALVFAALAAVFLLWGARAAQGAGLLDRWVRDAVVGQLEKMSGGRVELQGFHFDPFRWRVELSGLTVRGLEPEGTLPYFHADKVVLDIRVESVFRRKISLNEVQIDRPAVHVRVEADGSTNVPMPKGAPGRPLRERVFEVAIRRLRLNDGYVLFNDVRTPLVAEGGQFNFALDFNAPAAGKEFYLGNVSWQQMILVTRRYLPFASDVSLKFTLERGAFRLEQARWKLPHSELDAQATLANFAKPAWNFRYRGRLSLDDIRKIERKPNTPGGAVEFSGEGSYAGGRVGVRGRYAAHDVAMHYPWFHSAGMESHGSYRADSRTLELPDFEARALGGVVQGRLNVALRGLKFR